jgi:hypothetical protein
MTGRPNRLYAAGDVDALFPDQGPLTVVPWPGRTRGLRDDGDRQAVSCLLAQPPRADQFADLDPRQLRPTQPSLTRAGVAFYMCDEYRRSGRTYADQFNRGNRYPVVLERTGEYVLLSGHHRAAAALLDGRPLRTRLVTGPWTIDTTAATAITPSLFIGGDRPVVDHEPAKSAEAIEIWINLGTTAWMPEPEEAQIRHALFELAAADDAWADHLFHFGRTGRMSRVQPWPDEVDRYLHERNA